MKESPKWVEDWFYAHPAYTQYLSKFQTRFKDLGYFDTTDEVQSFIVKASEEVGLNVFSCRDNEIWITLHDYDLVSNRSVQ